MSLRNFVIAGIMGTVIQSYTEIVSNYEYLIDIYGDFSDGRYVQGSVKVILPYVAPFLVSSISGTIVKRDYEKKIGILEKKIEKLEND